MDFEKVFNQKVCKYGRIRNKCDKSRDLFNKYGGVSVFLSRFFFPGFGAPVNYISGFSKYSFRKFLVLSASGELMYALIYTSIGFIFRDSWVFLLDTIFDLSLTIILFLCALFAGYRLKKYL
jgi:membrane protein DedA with SNARE-associated domain